MIPCQLSYGHINSHPGTGYPIDNSPSLLINYWPNTTLVEYFSLSVYTYRRACVSATLRCNTCIHFFSHNPTIFYSFSFLFRSPFRVKVGIDKRKWFFCFHYIFRNKVWRKLFFQSFFDTPTGFFYLKARRSRGELKNWRVFLINPVSDIRLG